MFQGVHCEQLVVVSLHYVLACFVGALKTYDYQVFTTKIERINSAKKPQSSIVQRLNIQPRGMEFFTATRLIYQTRNTFLCQLIRPAVKLLNSQEPYQVIAQIRVSSNIVEEQIGARKAVWWTFCFMQKFFHVPKDSAFWPVASGSALLHHILFSFLKTP